MSVLAEAAEGRLCLSEEVAEAGLLSMEAAEGSSSLEGNGLGQEAGVQSGLEKEEEWERTLEQGGGDRVCQVEVVGVQNLGRNNELTNEYNSTQHHKDGNKMWRTRHGNSD